MNDYENRLLYGCNSSGSTPFGILESELEGRINFQNIILFVICNKKKDSEYFRYLFC